jgi:glycosyltransferase involved in cell wall biosynthesis
MNILHVTFDMRIGGTEMVIKNLIEGNTDPSKHMSIFCIESPLGPWGEQLKKKGVPISTKARTPGFDVSIITAIRKHIKHHKIDVVHCHQYTPWVYGTMAALFTPTKVVFTEHGRFYPDSTTWKRKLVNPLLSCFTHAVTAISEATKQAVSKFEYIPSNKIKTIYNGIKPLDSDTAKTLALKSELGFSTEANVLGTVARLDPIKNHVMLLHAFSIVCDQIPDAYLVIVGDGEMRQTLELLSEQLNIGKHVRFVGYKTNPTDYINLFDVFVLSSLSEGTSMTLLEAMSLSKPCVVTDAGGNPEIVKHNVSGLVVENDNAKAFANAIITLLEDPQQQAIMATQARQIFDEKFDVKCMNAAYRELYENISAS